MKAIIHNGRQVSMYSSAIESVIVVIINTRVVTRCRIVQLLLVSSKKVIETTPKTLLSSRRSAMYGFLRSYLLPNVIAVCKKFKKS